MRQTKRSLFLAVLLTLVSAPSLACDMPLIVGTLPNQSGGKILFLSSTANCPGKTHLDVLGSTSAGATIKGCWMGQQDVLVVKWNDGSTFAYPAEKAALTEAWVVFDECLKSGKSR